MRLRDYQYLIARRVIQTGILLLFIAGNVYGWNLLKGNLSAAKILQTVPLADPFAVMQSFAAGSSLATDVMIGGLVILLMYGIIGGRAFCGWVCPLNMVTDAANRMRRIIRLSEASDGRHIGRHIRYWMIALSLIISGILGVASFEWISPIGALHRGIIYGMGMGWSLVLMVFLFDLFGVKNGFCGHVCPLGGFYALTGRFGFLRIGYNRDRCTLCMKCVEICPERQVLDMVGVQSGPVRSGECINCGRCIEVCGDNAVRFSNIYSKKSFIHNKEGRS